MVNGTQTEDSLRTSDIRTDALIHIREFGSRISLDDTGRSANDNDNSNCTNCDDGKVSQKRGSLVMPRLNTVTTLVPKHDCTGAGCKICLSFGINANPNANATGEPTISGTNSNTNTGGESHQKKRISKNIFKLKKSKITTKKKNKTRKRTNSSRDDTEGSILAELIRCMSSAGQINTADGTGASASAGDCGPDKRHKINTKEGSLVSRLLKGVLPGLSSKIFSNKELSKGSSMVVQSQSQSQSQSLSPCENSDGLIDADTIEMMKQLSVEDTNKIMSMQSCDQLIVDELMKEPSIIEALMKEPSVIDALSRQLSVPADFAPESESESESESEHESDPEPDPEMEMEPPSTEDGENDDDNDNDTLDGTTIDAMIIDALANEPLVIDGLMKQPRIIDLFTQQLPVDASLDMGLAHAVPDNTTRTSDSTLVEPLPINDMSNESHSNGIFDEDTTMNLMKSLSLSVEDSDQKAEIPPESIRSSQAPLRGLFPSESGMKNVMSPPPSNLNASSCPPSRASFLSRSGNGTMNIICPTDVDILLGKGTVTNRHPGNIKYREMIARLKPEYQSLGNQKKKKKEFTEKVLADIQASGARFLKLVDVKGCESYTVISDKDAREKISQRFREKRGER